MSWLFLFFRKVERQTGSFSLTFSLSRKPNQPQLSNLGFSSLPPTWQQVLLLSKSWTFMFCKLLLLSPCKWTSLNTEAASWIGKTGMCIDLYLCWCNCVRALFVGPQHECHHLHKWIQVSHWRKKENATFILTQCCGLITTEKNVLCGEFK